MTSSPTPEPSSASAAPGGPSRRVVPLYLLGGGLSLLGNAAISLALPWLVLERTGDPTATAVVATAAGVAAVPATLVGGRLADRFGARRVAVAADVGSAAAVTALAALAATDGLTLTSLVLLGAAGALFDVPGQSARQALLADVADRGGIGVDQLAGWFQGAFAMAFLVGPALTGVLLSVLDAGGVVWLTAACSAGAAVATWLLPVQHLYAESSDADAQEKIPGAWRVVRGDRRLLATLVVVAAAALVTPPLMAVLLPGHFAALGRPGAYGLVLSAFAVGILAGSVAYPVLAARSRVLAYVTGVGAITAGMLGLAGLGPVPVLGAAMLVLGVGSGLYSPVWNVFVAEQVPARVRAGVLSYLNATALVAGPIGLGLLGLLLSVGSLRLASVLVAALWTVVAVFAVASRHARGIAEQATVAADDPTAPAGADEAAAPGQDPTRTEEP